MAYTGGAQCCIIVTMSRSKHTTPPSIRAARRVRAPYAPRGQGEHRRDRVLARLLKELGIVAESVETPGTDERPVQGPRLHAQRPRAGRIFALTLTDVRRVLSFF